MKNFLKADVKVNKTIAAAKKVKDTLGDSRIDPNVLGTRRQCNVLHIAERACQ